MNKKFVYKNQTIDKKQLRKIILWAFTNYGINTVSSLVDTLKTLGFYYATKAGLSLSLEDLKIPPEKTYTLYKAYNSTNLFNSQVERAELTEGERFQQVINTWNQTSENLKDQVIDYFKTTDPLNSIYIMAFSGARGNISQVRQLVGMRGLMADPNGEIIDLPIAANFREGLKITDYLISSFGARKGLVDTALKTADSGYLTRRLVDVAQDIIIREVSCSTNRGIHLHVSNSNILYEQLIGRVIAEDLIISDSLKFKKGDELNFETIDQLVSYIPFDIYIYSALTCKLVRSTCQQCYGWNLATNKLILLGEAVGVLAAQSIGEPGTQLTMRTFHTGGVFTGSFVNQIRASHAGQITISNDLKMIPFRTELGQIAYLTQSSGELYLKTYNNEIIRIPIASNTNLFIKNFTFVKKNSLIGELARKNEKKAIATKELKAQNSGEIFLDPRYFSKKKIKNSLKKTTTLDSGILWLFEGKLHEIPFSSELKLQNHKILLKNQIITRTKIKNTINGVFNIRKKTELNNSEMDNLTITSKLISLPFLKIIKNSNRDNFYLDFLNLILNYKPKNYNLLNNQEILASTILNKASLIYKNEKLCFETKALNFVDPKTISRNFLKSQEKLKTNLLINSNRKFFELNKLPQENDLILITDQFPFGKGYFQVKLTDFKAQKINFTQLIETDSTILYPGEQLFENFVIQSPCILEKCIYKNNIVLILSSLELYRLPSYQLNFKETLATLLFEYETKSVNKRRFSESIVELNLILKTNNGNSEPNSLSNYHKYFVNQEISPTISFFVKEHLTINIKEPLYLNIIAKPNQYLSSNSCIGYFELRNEVKQRIENWKLKQKDTLYLFFNTDQDYLNFYVEDHKFSKKIGDFVFKKDLINSNLQTPISGQIKGISGNSIQIQKASPYLFSKGTFLFVADEDLIYKNENLGLFLFEKTTTGDIVQGLPKVEEILEARKISKKGRLSKNFGLFLFLKHYKSENFFQLAMLTKKEIHVYRRLSTTVNNLEPGDFIYLNYQIKKGLNLHKLLYNYYKYFSNFNSIYESCYRSLRKIQVLIVSSIQQVYESQGVSISDKHIELIVRQMSSKVQIAKPGKTSLKSGEIIDLENIQYLNTSMDYFNESLATYIPILYGITRASLKTDSFISAASFQETTKVLTQAAIEGKIDWLCGLKENVIVGRLIPAGTGFNMYNQLLSQTKFTLPFYVQNQ